MSIRLIWLSPEITPYHDVLFRCLSSDPDISLRVEIMMGATKTHPFDTEKDRPYEWGMARSPDWVDRSLIQRVLQEEKAWVVVASYLKPTLMATMRALAAANRRFLYFTDTPLPQDVEWNAGVPRKRSFIRRWVRRRQLKWIFHHAYAVLATGQPGAQAVIYLGCPKDKVICFPFWVDLDNPHKVSFNSVTNILIGVGQLCHRKGYDLALRAFSSAIEKGLPERVGIKLIGDGPDRKALEGLALDLGLTHRATFSGWLQPSQVANELMAADAFIHPSRWDPFPAAVLEAMAAGLPVLGSDQSGSVLDRVQDGISGFIHSAGDVSQLTGHIIQTFANPEILVRMGLAARRKAEEWPPERGVQIIKSIVLNESQSSNSKTSI